MTVANNWGTFFRNWAKLLINTKDSLSDSSSKRPLNYTLNYTLNYRQKDP